MESEERDPFEVSRIVWDWMMKNHDRYGLGPDILWAMLTEAHGMTDKELDFDHFCGGLQWRATCEWDI